MKKEKITNLYRKLLENIPGITTSKDIEGVKYNYPYFVIRVDKKNMVYPGMSFMKN